MLTPILYREAATMLSLDEQRIRTAVSRDVLTQVPNRRSNKAVYREQVELFIGKPELSKRLLTADELERWTQIEQEAIHPVPAQSPAPAPAAVPTHVTVNIDPEKFVQELIRSGAQVSFPSAQADKAGNEQQVPAVPTDVSPGIALLVLLGLFALFFFKPAMERQAETNKRVEQIIRRIRLEKEDLATSQRKPVMELLSDAWNERPQDASLAKLKSHPQETMQLRELLPV